MGYDKSKEKGDEKPKKHPTAVHSAADVRFLSIGLLGAILFFIAERTDAHQIAFIFKPIPIFCLIGWVQWNAHSPSIHRRLVQLGLFFGSLGDILLSTGHRDAFIHGLLAFLVGHVFYAVAFRLITKERRLVPQALHLIPYLMWCSAVLWYLKTYGDVGPMFPALCAYTVVMTTVCWMSSLAAMERIVKTELPLQLWFWQKLAPLIGAILFTSSDMMIAFDRFIPEFHSTSTSRLIYMLMYYTGQAAFAYSTLE